MKQFLLTLISAFLLVSCSASIPQRLDSFVDSAELQSDSYSMKDWDKSISEYESLVEEYNSSDKSFSDAENQMAARAMGRYHALLLQNGLEKGAEALKEFGAMLPEYLEGLSEGIRENASDLEGLLENLIDTTKIESSVKKLGEALESILGPLED